MRGSSKEGWSNDQRLMIFSASDWDWGFAINVHNETEGKTDLSHFEPCLKYPDKSSARSLSLS